MEQGARSNDASSDSWMQDGKCRDYNPNVFFPGDGAGVEAAKVICRMCDVQTDCLEYALSNRIDYGVWGGQSERARKRILKRR